MRRIRQRPDTLRHLHGLPVLDRGAHRSPQHGACLMEYVSVLAGVRFSDHPGCTHPALAQLARMVNDETINPAARSTLAVLAPDLIGTRWPDPRIAPTVAACCLRAAVALRPHDRNLTRALQRLQSQLQRLDNPRVRRWTRWRNLLWDPAVWTQHHRLAAVLRPIRCLPTPGHDDQLRQLLEQAITDCRTLLTHAPAGQPLTSATNHPAIPPCAPTQRGDHRNRRSGQPRLPSG